MWVVKITSALVMLGFLSLAVPTVEGQTWLKVMPDDPFSKGGSFHMFDIDSAFEDASTGFVATRLVYTKPENAANDGASKWFLWAFDCKANNVYFVGEPAERGAKTVEGWRGKPTSLKEPHMGGVTNVLGRKLCALVGSWPKGKLPEK